MLFQRTLKPPYIEAIPRLIYNNPFIFPSFFSHSPNSARKLTVYHLQKKRDTKIVVIKYKMGRIFFGILKLDEFFPVVSFSFLEKRNLIGAFLELIVDASLRWQVK